MGSRELYKRARRIRVILGLILAAGIVAIMMIAYAYTPN
jgi:hypothetical protein